MKLRRPKVPEDGRHADAGPVRADTADATQGGGAGAGPDGAEAAAKRSRTASVAGGVRGSLTRHAAAWVSGITGLAITGFAARHVDRWAQARDAEQFETECRMVVGMLEQKLERYEAGLNRLRDVCSRYPGAIPARVWRNWVHYTLDVGSNFPNTRCLMVAHKVASTLPATPGSAVAETAPASAPGDDEVRLIVNHSRSWQGCQGPRQNDDVSCTAPLHPDFRPALGSVYGWLDNGVWHLPRQDGSVATRLLVCAAVAARRSDPLS